MPHEWIEVLNRRWCVRCDAFNARKTADTAWYGKDGLQGDDCPRTFNPKAVDMTIPPLCP
jgi:hypothetical protein